MKPLFLLFCLLFSLSSLFAQTNAGPGEKNDSAKPVLCSNAKGEHGFVVDKGNGHTEFQTVDQFLTSQAMVRSKNNNAQAAAANKAVTKAASSSQKNVAAADAVQKNNNDPGAVDDASKKPAVLGEGPPPHH